MDATASWDQRFRSGDYPRDPSPFVVGVVRGLPPGRALDLACGAGRHTRWLAARGWDVVAIDNSDEALKLVGAGTTLRLDLEREPLPFGDAAFDLVLIIRFLHRPLFAEAARVLIPGGVLVAEINRTGRFAMDIKELRFEGWRVMDEREDAIAVMKPLHGSEREAHPTD